MSLTPVPETQNSSFHLICILMGFIFFRSPTGQSLLQEFIVSATSKHLATLPVITVAAPDDRWWSNRDCLPPLS
ncbi:hypothetical protein DY000_02042097 [Brassica cretica]|uniref:Uncharacterized protein n=1 Tax=Brassica cretica TaxID=69181 RepID=A0ABQ7BEC8_BRACR|nr:hypothetical protein DY000_02042097 [Brassica cretica]